MKRRDLLLLRTEPAGRVAELSCERLYMQYQQTSLTMVRPGRADVLPTTELSEEEPSAVFDERTTRQLLGDVERELEEADVLRLVDTEWLAVDAFGRDVERVLASFRRRGGRVEREDGSRLS